jgi:Ca2+:H+ antiporter
MRSAPGGGGSAADLAADGSSPQPATASPQDPGPGAVVEPPEGADPEDKNNNNKKKKIQNVAVRFLLATKTILLYSKLNLALVFVPVGIIAKELHLAPGIVFAMNAIAIIPLAGLLSFATETVARRLGDTIGALLNVTFGNAVELIIL